MPPYGGNQGVPGSAGIPSYGQTQNGPAGYAQSPATPQNPGPRGFAPQGGYQGAYNQQGYGNMQMPGSAGGYGAENNAVSGWGQQRGGPNSASGGPANYGPY